MLIEVYPPHEEAEFKIHFLCTIIIIYQLQLYSTDKKRNSKKELISNSTRILVFSWPL